MRIYSYENKDGHLIFITESSSSAFRASVDNENAVHIQKAVAGYECDLYRYEDGGRVYIFQKAGTMIMLQADLSETECEKIIQSLRADNQTG